MATDRPEAGKHQKGASPPMKTVRETTSRSKAGLVAAMARGTRRVDARRLQAVAAADGCRTVAGWVAWIVRDCLRAAEDAHGRLPLKRVSLARVERAAAADGFRRAADWVEWIVKDCLRAAEDSHGLRAPAAAR